MQQNSAIFLLNYLKQCARLYPGVYAMFDDVRATCKKLWPEECYIPRTTILQHVTTDKIFQKPIYGRSFRNSGNKLHIHDSITRSIYAIYNWRSHKKIYRFDPDLAKILCDQADNSDPNKMVVDAKMFSKLPFNGMYIDAPIDEGICGTFITIDHIPKFTNVPVLVMSNIPEATREMTYGTNSKYIIIVPDPSDFELHDGKTVKECMNITTNKCYSSLTDADQCIKAYRTQWRILNMLMYIMSADADIEQSSETKDTYRPISDNTKLFRDNYNEIDLLNVGYRIGNIIRAHKESAGNRTQEGFKRTPHVRSGHWHKYWVGGRNSEDRHQITKWIPPIFVNGYTENMNIVSITPVK